MTVKLYPTLPTAPEGSSDQDKFNNETIHKQFQELIRLKDKFNTKYAKYNKILNRLLLINAGSNGISIGTGISSVATLSTFIGIPVSIALAACSLTGAGIGGITTVLIKRYQKKLSKINKLYDIVRPAIAVFEAGISKALKDNRIDYNELQVLGDVYYKALDALTSTDRKMETETRNQFEKSMMAELQNIKEALSPQEQRS